ncbi:Transcription cofactor vestigial-like protein 1 [Oryzias melastigma]|uniref:Transcription cofactor vestigial-like protein 1 n=1 Tax=Oryzias melastigma TaxID=30732 RepID=A0A834FM41_ORYME|nr:Transcription cofactor vestigial-like protein 1 [Oryzias melastigma]
MEEGADSPIAVKVEGNSRSVVLTYFQGDTSSMVDAHFDRALSKTSRGEEPAGRPRKVLKAVKSEDLTTCQDIAAPSYSEPQALSKAGCIMALGSPGGGHSSWQPFTSRPGEAPGLSTIMCLSSDGLSLTGQQYATSLLNLLHSDRGEVGPSNVSKPDTLPRWTAPHGFRESVDPSINFEQGRHVDKKNLYWY